MSSKPRLDLNTSPRTAVYRQLETILRTDPTLQRVVKTWRTWEGATGDTLELSPAAGGPSVRLTPVGSEEAFRFPNALVGSLTVGVEVAIPGTCVDDVLNLWYAIERALYPTSQATRQTIQQALQTAGANTGMCTFSAPSLDLDDGRVNWLVNGQIKIDLRLPLNT